MSQPAIAATCNAIWHREFQGSTTAMRSIPNKSTQVAIVSEWLAAGGNNTAMVKVADKHHIVDPGVIWSWALKLHMCEWHPGHNRWVLRSGWRE